MHSHISKVLEWKLDKQTNYVPKLYGCTECNETSTEPFPGWQDEEHTHEQYVDGCFACKVITLHLNAGDARGELLHNGYTKKSWNKELDAYKSARAQGIQPDGTSMEKIQKAVDISNKTGYAYGSKL